MPICSIHTSAEEVDKIFYFYQKNFLTIKSWKKIFTKQENYLRYISEIPFSLKLLSSIWGTSILLMNTPYILFKFISLFLMIKSPPLILIPLYVLFSIVLLQTLAFEFSSKIIPFEQLQIWHSFISNLPSIFKPAFSLFENEHLKNVQKAFDFMIAL